MATIATEETFLGFQIDIPPFPSPQSQHRTQPALDACPKRQAIKLRNAQWQDNVEIPKWVKVEDTELDQYFTKPEVAKKCFASLEEFLAKQEIGEADSIYVEPSAGIGSFYSLLPPGKRIGVDVEAFNPEYIKADFLSWRPIQTKGNFICVGNPPFGYRAWLALAFLNHAASFCDVVAFILPMAFQSRGKGNPQDRVRGMRLAHSEVLPSDSFMDEKGRTLRVNCLWQIWVKDDGTRSEKKRTCNEFIDLFTVDKRKERLCGQARMEEADFFLQRTYYTDPPTLVKSFNDVKYGCGYGIVIKKNKKAVIKALRSADWIKHSNLASHNCRHISMEHIRNALIEQGVEDV